MGWTARALPLLVCTLVAAPALAQTTPLPPVPELKLKFPIQPLSFSYRGAEVGNYQNGPLRLFRAESVWIHTPVLKLLSYGAAEQAAEWDCRLGCQPIVRFSTGVAARLSVPTFTPALTDTHVYVRSAVTYTSELPRRHRLFEAGFAGAF